MKILESSGLKTPISCTFVKNDIDSFFSDLCRHIYCNAMMTSQRILQKT